MKTIKKLKSHPYISAWIVLFVNLVLAIAGDIHLPALPMMVKDLNTTEFYVQLMIAIFIVGATVGRLTMGALSDQFGRKNILLFSLSLQIVAIFGCAIAKDIQTLLIWRTVQSMGAGVGSVVGTAIIADLFHDKERARFYGLLEMTFPIGFIIGPILGAYILEVTNTWRAAFFLMVVVYSICVLLILFLMNETHHEKIKETLGSMLKMYHSVLKNWEFMRYTSILSLIIASYLIFVISAPFIYMQQFGLTAIEFGYIQLVPMTFNFLSFMLYRSYIKHKTVQESLKLGMSALFAVIPLYLIIGFQLVKVNQFWIVCAISTQSLIVPFIIPGLTTLSLDIYPNRKGLAAAVVASMRTLLAGFGMIAVSYIFGSGFQAIFIIKAIIISFVIYLSRKIIFNK